jgi:hypothetical protein
VPKELFLVCLRFWYNRQAIALGVAAQETAKKLYSIREYGSYYQKYIFRVGALLKVH